MPPGASGPSRYERAVPASEATPVAPAAPDCAPRRFSPADEPAVEHVRNALQLVQWSRTLGTLDATTLARIERRLTLAVTLLDESAARDRAAAVRIELTDAGRAALAEGGEE